MFYIFLFYVYILFYYIHIYNTIYIYIYSFFNDAVIEKLVQFNVTLRMFTS